MKRKHLGIGILMIALLLSGCSRQNATIYEPETTQASSTETKLTFFGFKYEAINVAAIEDSLRSFMQKNNRISITYEGIKGVNYYEVLDKRINTKNGDDIFMVDQASVLALKKKGALADLSDLSTINNFSDLVKNQMVCIVMRIYWRSTGRRYQRIYRNSWRSVNISSRKESPPSWRITIFP